MMNKYDQRACIAYAEKKGREEGVVIGEARGEARGKKEGILQAAKNMLAKGYSIAEVIGITNLSREQVRALNKA